MINEETRIEKVKFSIQISVNKEDTVKRLHLHAVEFLSKEGNRIHDPIESEEWKDFQ